MRRPVRCAEGGSYWCNWASHSCFYTDVLVGIKRFPLVDGGWWKVEHSASNMEKKDPQQARVSVWGVLMI